jgi:DNA (cytosine-5)-methyltransferase 1
LFSGCGGADKGMVGEFLFNNHYYDALPFEIIYAIDINKKALETHKANFNCKNVICEDIKNISTDNIPEHDVLVGGFPCQSFSTVNPTKDPFDERANLYKEMARIAKDKQPRIIIAENVKGLMTLHKGKIFDRVIKEFNDAGYNMYPKLINAANFGVPQKRERVIIVGVRKDILLEYSFPEETHSVAGNPKKWVPLSVAIDKLELEEEKYYFSKRAVEGMKNAKNNMKRGLAQDLDKPCLTITSHLAKVSLNSRDPVLLVKPEEERYRRFTPREAARIQSFPDDFNFVGSDADAYRQIGNAIPPVMFWHISNSIKEFLEDLEDIENEDLKEEKAI